MVETQEAYRWRLKEDLQMEGLKAAVKKRLDEISHEGSALPYSASGHINEMCVEIYDLVSMAKGGNDGNQH